MGLGWGGQQGPGRKNQFIRFLRGINLGSSCCGRGEPVSSTPGLPFNPSQHGPEGEDGRGQARARPGPMAA